MDYNEFEDEAVRSVFVQKVYMLLSLEILVSFGSVLIVKLFYEEQAFYFFLDNMYILYICLGIVIVISIVLSCFPGVARTYPVNYLMLVLFVVAFTVITVAITMRYKTDLILICMGITFGITFVISLLACIAKVDVTNWYWFILVLCLILLGLGIARIFVKDHTFRLVYAGIALVIYSFFLFYDTRLIVSGAHQARLNSDEYVIGSLCLYTNIMQIFLHTLQLISAINE